MLAIRLSRVGKKNQPQFRLIIQERQRSPLSRAIEIVGNIDPRRKTRTLKKERIQYWLSQGAKPSETVHNMLIDEGILTGEKMHTLPSKKKTDKPRAEGATTAAEKPSEPAKAAPEEKPAA